MSSTEQIDLSDGRAAELKFQDGTVLRVRWDRGSGRVKLTPLDPDTLSPALHDAFEGLRRNCVEWKGPSSEDPPKQNTASSWEAEYGYEDGPDAVVGYGLRIVVGTPEGPGEHDRRTARWDECLALADRLRAFKVTES